VRIKNLGRNLQDKVVSASQPEQENFFCLFSLCFDQGDDKKGQLFPGAKCNPRENPGYAYECKWFLVEWKFKVKLTQPVLQYSLYCQYGLFISFIIKQPAISYSHIATHNQLLADHDRVGIIARQLRKKILP